MSFVDLATLTMHRRNELDARINLFADNCDHAINDIKKLKSRALGFLLDLNCDPSDLKERFLNCMRQLDEFMYIITDFNLAIEKLGDTACSEITPVPDSSIALSMTPQHGQINLMDALSEPAPSTSAACSNFCPPSKPERIKVPKQEQSLIVFSSTSSCAESADKIEIATKGVQSQMVKKLENVKIEDTVEPALESCDLPPQTVLETDHKYTANIMHVDATNIWVITSDCAELLELMGGMKHYYSNNYVEIRLDTVKTLTCCAFYSTDCDCYYRGLFLDILENGNVASVFAVDTGEIFSVEVKHLQPIVPQFCVTPPFARCCHLAGVDLSNNQSNELMQRQEEFLKNYMGETCTIEVDDNTSESLGVYVMLPSKEILNDLFIKAGLGAPIDRTPALENIPLPAHGPPEMADSDLDITQCPEYEDPVLAVTGYHNRDEADICKHYKGGAEKTCFKGSKCTKRHIMKHPDGWTLDRVEVLCKLSTKPLPPPGSWHMVRVMAVCHFNMFYAQFLDNKQKKDRPANFGDVQQPAELEAIVQDMNSSATRMAYKPLTICPAPGELVAALYPMDNRWYRACVQTVTRADQNVEVMYVDYGTVLSVHAGSLRALPRRLAAVPAQAVLCRLAGVRAASHNSQQWIAAKEQFVDLVLDKVLEACIIQRDYDELVVELLDSEQYNISELLATQKLVNLTPYNIVDDTKLTQQVIVP